MMQFIKIAEMVVLYKWSHMMTFHHMMTFQHIEYDGIQKIGNTMYDGTPSYNDAYPSQT